MRFRLLRRWAVVSALTLSASAVRAEPDSFGIGDGHSGPKAITAADPATAGEVDSYAGSTVDVSPGDTSIAITTTVLGAAFRANDLVMIWRGTGVDASEDASGDQTKRLDLSTALATTSSPALSAGLVGRYELARVSAVNGSALTLTKPLLNGFTKNVSQVVRIPEFTTVNVGAGAELRALPWQEIGGDPANPNHNNPWAGGILVFFANGAIQNDGTIHANERGFHGGTPQARNVNNPGLTCNGTRRSTAIRPARTAPSRRKAKASSRRSSARNPAARATSRWPAAAATASRAAAAAARISVMAALARRRS